MRVLITGANGFIGKAIGDQISEKNISKNAFQLYRLTNSKLKSGKVGAGFKDVKNAFLADISDYENLIEAVKIEGIDVIIHSAGLAHQFGKQAKDDFWKINVQGTENIAKLGVKLQIKHFILISSVSVYGTTQAKQSNSYTSSGISEDAICNPQGFYARSKLESEKVAIRICKENKIALTILRLATVIGEEDKGNVARLINAIDKKRFVWIGSGENLKSLIYKKDVARACLEVVGKSKGTDIFNVTAQPVKMNEIVSQISLSLGKRVPKWHVSPILLKKFFRLNSEFAKIKKINKLAETIDKWLSDDVFSGEKFKEAYNFEAETPISEAIKRQVETYKKLK